MSESRENVDSQTYRDSVENKLTPLHTYNLPSAKNNDDDRKLRHYKTNTEIVPGFEKELDLFVFEVPLEIKRLNSAQMVTLLEQTGLTLDEGSYYLGQFRYESNELVLSPNAPSHNIINRLLGDKPNIQIQIEIHNGTPTLTAHVNHPDDIFKLHNHLQYIFGINRAQLGIKVSFAKHPEKGLLTFDSFALYESNIRNSILNNLTDVAYRIGDRAIIAWVNKDGLVEIASGELHGLIKARYMPPKNNNQPLQNNTFGINDLPEPITVIENAEIPSSTDNKQSTIKGSVLFFRYSTPDGIPYITLNSASEYKRDDIPAELTRKIALKMLEMGESPDLSIRISGIVQKLNDLANH